MIELFSIPRRVPPRTSPECDQKIPRIIWQTMKTTRVPKVMHEYSNSWTEQNPEYEYRFLDDEELLKMMTVEFAEYMPAFKKAKIGAIKADLWRYLVIYKHGGVYADMDCRCMVPLRNWVQPEAAWVTQLGINRDVCQWLIISVPGNPVFKKAAEKSFRNLTNAVEFCEYSGFELAADGAIQMSRQQRIKSFHPVMKLAGPPVLQKSAEECFVSPEESGIFRSTQIVCVSGNSSCQMNGNVQHTYRDPQYVEALKQLSTPHYEDRQPGRFSSLFRRLVRS